MEIFILICCFIILAIAIYIIAKYSYLYVKESSISNFVLQILVGSIIGIWIGYLIIIKDYNTIIQGLKLVPLIFILLIIGEFIKSIYILNLLTTKLDPDKFINETDKQIDKINNNLQKFKLLKESNLKYIEMLKLNKTAGLIYKGLFEETQDLFNSIDPNKVDLSYRTLYEINYICFLYSAGRVDDANRLYLEKQESIENLVNNKKFRITTLGLISTYNYYQGNYNRSKELIIEMKKSKLPKIIDVECEYWLALIDIKQDKIEEGKARLEALLEPTKKLYLNELIKKELEL